LKEKDAEVTKLKAELDTAKQVAKQKEVVSLVKRA
jgi:hypothetical protein